MKKPPADSLLKVNKSKSYPNNGGNKMPVGKLIPKDSNPGKRSK